MEFNEKTRKVRNIGGDESRTLFIDLNEIAMAEFEGEKCTVTLSSGYRHVITSKRLLESVRAVFDHHYRA